MTPFQKFAQLVNKRFNDLSKHELFVVGNDNRHLEQVYLAAFPEGTNPIYKTNTEHDCNCCKQHLRNIGNVVAIIDNEVCSVWQIEGAEYPYDVVAAALDQAVKALPVTSLFRPEEDKFGKEHTNQALEDGSVKRWNHLHGVVSVKHIISNPGSVKGEYATGVQVMQRGLTELKVDTLETVRQLINDKQLYRGDEFSKSVKEFAQAQQAYLALPEAKRANFLWANANKSWARFRNTMMGTLVVDLSEGVPLEGAVRIYESKAAPENYKRTTALVTPRMIEDAMATIRGLGLETALERRFARIGDITIDNVLWANNEAKGHMKGGLEDLLLASVAQPTAKLDKAEDIGIEEFMARILPQATDIQMLVQNKHKGNFVSLTAPVHADVGQLFKWPNNFAHSYTGNTADSSMRRAVVARGGRVDGVFRFTHQWNYRERNASLMDLHVFMPGSNQPRKTNIHDDYGNDQRVGWNNRNHHGSGGKQDVDYTAPAPEGYVPVENVTFPDLSRMPDGDYVCRIHNWNLREPTKGGFKAELEVGGQLYEYEFIRPLKHKEWVDVATARKKGSEWTVEHHLPVGAASQDAYGIKTETLIKVNTVMLSPNFWDGNAVGNKHWFFMLQDCKSSEPVRGIYNEFLSGELDKHRKVFDLIADKTKCPVTDDQLSGLGFSSTIRNSVTVQVTGAKMRKAFNINF